MNKPTLKKLFYLNIINRLPNKLNKKMSHTYRFRYYQFDILTDQYVQKSSFLQIDNIAKQFFQIKHNSILNGV